MGKEYFLNYLRKIGIDKSVAYSSGARVVQGVTGIVTVLMIAGFLSKVDQGYYYTFGSILAIQIFFELGLTNILIQFVGHEMAGLEWKEVYKLSGNTDNISRIAHLLRFSVRWYGFVSLMFILITVVCGIVFFSHFSVNTNDSIWLAPWILVCVSTGLSLFLSPVLAVLTGMGKVKEVSRIRFYQQLITPLLSWILFITGFKLYVLGLSSLLSSIIIVILITRNNLLSILKFLWGVEIDKKISYRNEIFPYQWKIALSWVSSYFVVQFFNPVLFATSGAVVAGQMGMTLTALNSISAFSQSWISTKIPIMSRLIALKDYFQLDKLFRTTVRQMSIVCFMLLIVMLLILEGMQLLELPLRNRFLPLLPLSLMIVAMFTSQFVNAWAVYLRCHKKEPLLAYSIVTGTLCCISTLVMGLHYGVVGITAGYCTIITAMSLWAHNIYVRKKIEWHDSVLEF